MEWYLIVGLAVLAFVAIYRLLGRVSAAGGTSERDAAVTANLILGEANAFRGSQSADDPPWDGHNRLAPPTQDGHRGRCLNRGRASALMLPATVPGHADRRSR